MKNKRVISQLNKLSEDDAIKVTLTMSKRGLDEVCYHNGEWNGKKFYCESVTNWRAGELFTEGMSVEDLITLLTKKELSEIEDSDFYGLEVVETIDGQTEIDNVEWEQLLTEEEETDLNKMDLYWFSEITDSELQFGPGSIESIKIEFGENSTIII